jgi:membrane-associated phospholipid phosphatase
MDRRLVVILLLLIVSCTLLSIAAYTRGVFRSDLMVALWIQGEHYPAFTDVLTPVSYPGDGVVPAVLVIVASTLCAVRKKWVEAVFIVATLSASLIAVVLKELIARPRPASFTFNPSALFSSVNQYAYPSGHVLFYVVFFGFLAFLSYRHFSGWLRWIIISSCATLIVLIGPSRIYLGGHWLSDVIASYILGTLWLILLILLYLKVLSSRIEPASH